VQANKLLQTRYYLDNFMPSHRHSRIALRAPGTQAETSNAAPAPQNPAKRVENPDPEDQPFDVGIGLEFSSKHPA
jgi:hypothetical protein